MADLQPAAAAAAVPAAAVPEPAAGALNMAVDQALFRSVQAGGAPVLRFYRWSPACLSLGRHQRALGVYDPARVQARGWDVVRRPTGGLAVLHDAELTYAVIAPTALLGGPRRAYLSINQALVAGLHRLGVGASLGTGPDARGPSPDAMHPCFERPAPGEVVVGGRKLVGSAQRVERHTLLQHGSVLLAGSQDDVLALHAPAVPIRAAAGGDVTLTELLGAPPPWRALLDALQTAFAGSFGVRLVPAGLAAAERAAVAAELDRFSADSWTWRR